MNKQLPWVIKLGRKRAKNPILTKKLAVEIFKEKKKEKKCAKDRPLKTNKSAVRLCICARMCVNEDEQVSECVWVCVLRARACRADTWIGCLWRARARKTRHAWKRENTEKLLRWEYDIHYLHFY